MRSRRASISSRISIHALRVEGDFSRCFVVALFQNISIHALRVEGDRYGQDSILLATTFLSTPSGWRATTDAPYVADKLYISIHALRVEGDVHDIITIIQFICDFYPRPPGGGRRICSAVALGVKRFLSTPSGWRATVLRVQYRFSAVYFYPRPPGGGRLHLLCGGHIVFGISIHALRVEGDSCGNTDFIQHVRISIHALRVEGDVSL